MEKVQQEMKNPTRFTFDSAAEHVYTLLLKKDCYPRFIRSEHYRHLLAAGVQPLQKKRYSNGATASSPFGIPRSFYSSFTLHSQIFRFRWTSEEEDFVHLGTGAWEPSAAAASTVEHRRCRRQATRKRSKSFRIRSRTCDLRGQGHRGCSEGTSLSQPVESHRYTVQVSHILLFQRFIHTILPVCRSSPRLSKMQNDQYRRLDFIVRYFQGRSGLSR